MTTETQAPDPARAETWLRSRFGAYRQHPAWRELEEAFNAGAAIAAARNVPAIPAPEGAPGDMALVPRELIKDAAESVDDYRCSLEFGAHDRKLLGRLKAALAAPAPDENSGSAEEYHKALAAPAPQALPATLTDEMRSVLTNEKCVYGSADELYAALLSAAPQTKEQP